VPYWIGELVVGVAFLGFGLRRHRTGASAALAVGATIVVAFTVYAAARLA
jgi:hypothetical protein